MNAGKEAGWLQAIEDEIKSPSQMAAIKPEDRLYRLYPQHIDWMRRVPVSIPSLLQEEREDVFLKSVYHHILLRDPDAGGYTHHLERLHKGEVSRYDLLMSMLMSGEGRQVNRKIHSFWRYYLTYQLDHLLPRRMQYSKRLIGRLLKAR